MKFEFVRPFKKHYYICVKQIPCPESVKALNRQVWEEFSHSSRIDSYLEYELKSEALKRKMNKPAAAACLRCTLRSGRHEIPTMIRTFSCGLEINHTCKWVFGNFPGIKHILAFLENYQKSIYFHGCSPIQIGGKGGGVRQGGKGGNFWKSVFGQKSQDHPVRAWNTNKGRTYGH